MNFNDLSKDNLEQLVNQLKVRAFDITTVKSASKIIHEASHYFDNLATLTGQVLLVKVYNALNELQNGTEKSRIIDLFMFAPFYYHGKFIGNVPFSIKALWETNAIWAEIIYHYNVAFMLKDQATRTVEIQQVEKKYKISIIQKCLYILLLLISHLPF